MSKKVQIVQNHSESSLVVTVGKKVVVHSDYDEVGWSGLELLENTVKNLCEALDVKVKVVETD